MSRFLIGTIMPDVVPLYTHDGICILNILSATVDSVNKQPDGRDPPTAYPPARVTTRDACSTVVFQ